MKNLLKAVLLISLSALSFSSCIVDKSNDVISDVWVFSKEYDAGTVQRPWIQDAQGLYHCNVRINELTGDIYEKGILAAYFVYQVGNNWVDSPLPFDDFFIEDNGNRYTYQYTCEFSPGLVTFLFKDNSFFERNPPVCKFVVKMMR